MSERNISTILKTSLLDNDSFTYYHLVKFEKPQISGAKGTIAGIGEDYVYLTDGPHTVEWDDNSTDSTNNPNGSQKYFANKLVSVGGVQETTQAKASTMTLKLSTASLGLVVGAPLSIDADINFITGYTDFIDEGVREGDTLLINSGGANDDAYIRIDYFISPDTDIPNSKIQYTLIKGSLSNDASPVDYTLTLVSDELTALTRSQDDTATVYSNYINREVLIYRVHESTETGAVIGAPFLLFRGIVSQASIQENPGSQSTISWALSSHWGDFVRVQGRLTSDSAHRALSITGKSDADALIRPEYASDYGFAHAERSVNVLGIYQAKELRYKMVKKGGISGWFGGKKVKEYYETVDREVDLRFDLSAKYIPVVYGVQKVSNIPIFADIDVNEPSHLYTGYALAEGEIGGIFDIYIEDQPSVCSDDQDAAVRDVPPPSVIGEENADANVDVICYGRADRGYVLNGTPYTLSSMQDPIYADIYEDLWISPTQYYGVHRWAPRDVNFSINQNQSDPTGGQGLTHEISYTFEIPIDASFVVHTGKADQEADAMLVGKALHSGFKIQTDYYEGDPANYWSTSHTLLDTAYVTAFFQIGEGEESVPQYEFVMKGKFLECYNYDNSYKKNPDITSDLESYFEIGQLVNVSVRETPGTWTGTIHQDAIIVDKWRVYNKEGIEEYRFRLFTDYPTARDTFINLGEATQLRMHNVSANKYWYMVTHDYVKATGAVTNLPFVDITAHSYAETAPSSGLAELTITLDPGDSNYTYMSSLLTASVASEKVYVALTTVPEHSFAVLSWAAPILILQPYSDSGYIITAQDVNVAEIYLANAVQALTAAGSASAGDSIEITRLYDTSEIPTTITKGVAYLDAANLIMYTQNPFNKDFVPGINTSTALPWTQAGITDEVSIIAGEDLRVSINPAMQLLDYMTSERYGRGLNKDEVINLDTFLESARLCDDQSNVTILTSTLPSALTEGAWYTFNHGARLVFRGMVLNNSSGTAYDTFVYDGTTYYQIIFTYCSGKLGTKWNDWKIFKAGDIVWAFDGIVKLATSDSILTKAAFDALTSWSGTIVKESGTGPPSIVVNTNSLGGLKGTNPVVRSWNVPDEAFSSPGYSLYDSDDVKYWKYLGWDSHDQRWVTRHQMNQVINTSVPIFDNMNSMLKQFNGLLRYANGKYELDIKTAAPDFSATGYWIDGITLISEDDIIGNIKLDDKGQKQSYNSISANIVDPQNKFGARSISFFNSTYLKEDKGVSKQGSYSLPGVSNYYNARTNIEQYLDESRYGLTVSFTMDQKGYLLLTGNVVALTYRRFNWTKKMFRIDMLTITPNGLVNIVAKEHNQDAFLIDYSDRSSTDNINDGTGNPGQIKLAPPTNLTASIDLRGEILLNWDNTAEYDRHKQFIEVWSVEAARVGDIPTNPYIEPYEGGEWTDGPEFIERTSGAAWTHSGLNTDEVTVRYYWVRYVQPAITAYQVTKYSKFQPFSSDTGVEGISLFAGGDGLDALTLILSNETHTFPADYTGDVTSFVNSGTDMFLYEGATLLDYDGTGTSPGTWKVTPSPVNITMDVGWEVDAGDYLTVLDHTAMAATDHASIVYTVVGKRGGGEAIASLWKEQTFNIATSGADGDQGSAGEDSNAVKLTAATYVVVYDENEENPIPEPTILLTATAQNVADPWFKFTGDGFSDQVSFSSTATFSWPVPSGTNSYFNTPKTIRVDVSDNAVDNTQSQAFDTISISAVHPGLDGSLGIDARSVNLTAADLTFVYDPAGVLIQPADALVTAEAFNYSGVPYYNFLLDDISEQNTIDATWLYTPDQDVANMPQKIEVELREDGDGGVGGEPVLARDQISMLALMYGTDSITMDVPNEAHTLPTTNSGSVDYANSGTTISIYEGGNELIYDPIAINLAALANGTWRFALVTDINIDVGAITLEVNHALVGIHDIMIADQATVTYEVEGKRADGRTFTIEKRQSLAKSIQGADGAGSETVKLSANQYILRYNTDGTETDTINFTTTYANVVVPYYEFFVGVTSKRASNTTSTFTLDQLDEPAIGTSILVKVEVREGLGGAIVAEDSVSIYAVQDGSDATIGYLTNAAHTVAADADGVVASWTGTDGYFKVNVGGTDVSTGQGVVYATAGATLGMTSTMNATTGYYSVTAMSSDSGVASYTATVPAALAGTSVDYVIPLDFSVAKSIEGVQGLSAKTAKLDANKYVINYSTAGTEIDVINFTALATGISVPYYEFFVDTFSKRVSNTTATFTLQELDEPGIGESVVVRVDIREGNGGVMVASDSVSVYAVQDGSDSTLGFLTNAAHVVATDENGAGGSYGTAGGTFKVYVGGVDKTTTGSIVYSNPSEVGVSISIVSTTGVYTVASTSADLGTAILRAVVPAATAGTAADITIDLTYSISRSKAGPEGLAGTNGVTIVLSNEAHTVPADENGLPTSFAGSGTMIYLYDGNTPLNYSTTLISQGYWSVTGRAYGGGIVGGSETDSGNYVTWGVVSGFPDPNNTGYIDYTIQGTQNDGTAFSIVKRQSFSKSKTGDFGLDANTVSIEADYYVITYNADGDVALVPTSTQDVDITATAYNYSTPRYSFSVNGGAYTAWSSTNTYTYQVSNTYSVTPVNITVRANETDTSTGAVYDSLTIAKIKPGIDGPDGNSPYYFVLSLAGANTLTWSKDAAGDWSPTDPTTWLLGYVYKDGVAQNDGSPIYQQVSATRNSVTGVFSYAETQDHHDDVVTSATGIGTNAMTITWQYKPGGGATVATLTQSVTSIVAGGGGGATGNAVVVGGIGFASDRVRWSYLSTGEVWKYLNGVGTNVGDWHIGGTATDYEISAFVGAEFANEIGELTTGTLSGWEQLGSISRSWEYDPSGVGLIRIQYTIRNRTTEVVESTGFHTFTVEP